MHYFGTMDVQTNVWNSDCQNARYLRFILKRIDDDFYATLERVCPPVHGCTRGHTGRLFQEYLHVCSLHFTC